MLVAQAYRWNFFGEAQIVIQPTARKKYLDSPGKIEIFYD